MCALKADGWSGMELVEIGLGGVKWEWSEVEWGRCSGVKKKSDKKKMK